MWEKKDFIVLVAAGNSGGYVSKRWGRGGDGDGDGDGDRGADSHLFLLLIQVSGNTIYGRLTRDIEIRDYRWCHNEQFREL